MSAHTFLCVRAHALVLSVCGGFWVCFFLGGGGGVGFGGVFLGGGGGGFVC